MKPFGTSGAACSGQNRATVQEHNHAIVRGFFFLPTSLIIGCIFVSLNSFETYGKTYEMEGEIQHSIFDGTGKIIEERQKPFKVFVSDTNWWIETKGIKPRVVSGDSEELKKLGISLPAGKKVYLGSDGSTSATEWGSIGSVLFVKQISPRQDSSDLTETNSTHKPVPFSSEFIEIYTNISAPCFRSDLCFPVWLAYCSSQAFPNGQMYSPPLIWEGFFPTASKGDEFSIISKRREQIGMPFMEEVQFINRGYSGFYDAASTKYLVQQLPGVKPYTEARFFVSSWGTLGDFAYPQVSYFEVYPMPKQSAGALPSAVIRVMVSVTSFTISTNEVPSILPTDLARVTDHRISTTAGPLTYLTTNLFIQPNSSTAIAAIKNFDRRSKDKNEIEMPATKFDSALLRATICLAFFLPLIWIFIHNKKQQTKNTTKL